jgi:hypothetical protein
VGIGKAEPFEQIAPLAPLLVALRLGSQPLLSNDQFAELGGLSGQPLRLDELDLLAEVRLGKPVDGGLRRQLAGAGLAPVARAELSTGVNRGYRVVPGHLAEPRRRHGRPGRSVPEGTGRWPGEHQQRLQSEVSVDAHLRVGVAVLEREVDFVPDGLGAVRKHGWSLDGPQPPELCNHAVP